MTPSHENKRPILEDERDQLARRIDELTIGGEIDLEFDNDFADRGQVTGEQGENYTLADSLQVQLKLVERALERLDDGSYGSCEVCGKVVGADRLEAMPATGRCIEHA